MTPEKQDKQNALVKLALSLESLAESEIASAANYEWNAQRLRDKAAKNLAEAHALRNQAQALELPE